MHNSDKHPHSSLFLFWILYTFFFKRNVHININMKAWSVHIYEWTWYIYTYYVYIYIYINSILIDDGDTKGSPRNALILCRHIYIYVHVCHFIISFSPLFTEEDVETRNKRNEEQSECIYVCMNICLWPIGILCLHVAHTNINGIFLCYRHNRPTKKRRIRKRWRESTSFFVYRQTPVEAEKG